MQNDTCPACQTGQSRVVSRVATADLERLYRRAGVEVAVYFRGVGEIRMNRCLICDLVFFAPHCAGDDVFYEQLQKFDWYYQDDKPEYAYCRKLVGESDAVLEVGCGKGAFRSWLASSVQYTGLEFNGEAVRKATQAGLNVMRQSVEEHAASAPGSYDVVCSFQVLEHVPEPRGFIQACVQALKPGGKLIIAVPAEDSFLGIAADAHLNMPPHHVLRWTDRALLNLAFREGLHVIDLWHEPVADYHQQWHSDTLARHYFVQRGFARHALVDRSLGGRLLGRVLRNARLRDYLANQTAQRLPQAGYGHTVVLAAGKPAFSEVRFNAVPRVPGATVAN